MLADTDFVAQVRRGIETEIQNRKDDLASGKLGTSVEEIALKATRISSQITGLEVALEAIRETIKGHTAE